MARLAVLLTYTSQVTYIIITVTGLFLIHLFYKQYLDYLYIENKYNARSRDLQHKAT